MNKVQWRATLLDARRTLSAQVRAAEAAALTRWAATLPDPAGAVCAYVPHKTEPGSIDMLDTLLQRAGEIWLPIIEIGSNQLLWATYQGVDDLIPGAFGIGEPSGPRVKTTDLTGISTVLVPALAVDRQGTRLGRGGGFYDRTLPLWTSAVKILAVIRDEELVDELPAQPHDVAVTGVLTPGCGVRLFHKVN